MSSRNQSDFTVDPGAVIVYNRVVHASSDDSCLSLKNTVVAQPTITIIAMSAAATRQSALSDLCCRLQI